MKAKQNRGSTNPLSPRALTASGRKSNLLSDKVVINTIMPPNTITLKKSQVRVQFKWEVRNTQWRIGIAMPKKRERLHQGEDKVIPREIHSISPLNLNQLFYHANVSSLNAKTGL